LGWAVTDRERAAITAVPEHLWAAAVDTDGQPRGGAHLAEITALLPVAARADYPDGTRVIVRRERPHPGAQLSLFEERDGWRHTAFATDTRVGQLAFLDARHRAHARVEDRTRCGKETGLGRFPSRDLAVNTAWLTAVLTAADLLAWAQTLLLHGELARATGSCTWPPASPAADGGSGSASTGTGPGQAHLAAAFTRLAALPIPGHLNPPWRRDENPEDPTARAGRNEQPRPAPNRPRSPAQRTNDQPRE
jgi:hypothetical protein